MQVLRDSLEQIIKEEKVEEEFRIQKRGNGH